MKVDIIPICKQGGKYCQWMSYKTKIKQMPDKLKL